MLNVKRIFWISYLRIFVLRIFHLNAVEGFHLNKDPDEPFFAHPLQNISVSVGREASLSCVVNNLGTFKIGWMKADQTVLALATKVVTQNSRFTVAKDEPNIWTLRIKSVKPSDRGCYMCQINTSPLQKQLGCIDIHVPPDILNEESSGDITINEGESISLFCNAQGNPAPRIIWRRSNGQAVVLDGKRNGSVETFNGNSLNLTNVGRKQIGAYLCIASNDIPPAVSKRVYLAVQFPPLVTTSRTTYGIYESSDTTIECIIEAYPMEKHVWRKASELSDFDTNIDVNKLLASPTKSNESFLSQKYEILEEKLSDYKLKLVLRIKSFDEDDAGTYLCISENRFGRANKSVQLYEIKRPTSTTTKRSTTIITTTTITAKEYATAALSSTMDTSPFMKNKMFKWLFTTPTPGPTSFNDLIHQYSPFTPPNHHIDHYIGETYLNQPTSIFSNSPKLISSTKSTVSLINFLLAPLLISYRC